ncbi:hypothetical protein [Streptomonospora salina]|uniref:Uncharacterized protein n=1 Tax=Streptomonospora salina TaxID=104205 RepID=A0A841E4U9_9ACTN|nr:hypothetical protein [Streptomonospora salina]MBB5998887.1 hypothetical protein [Streptomonospora salina]
MDEILSGLTDPYVLFALFYIACAVPLLFTPTWRLLRSSAHSQDEPSSTRMRVVRLALVPLCLLAAVFVVVNI